MKPSLLEILTTEAHIKAAGKKLGPFLRSAGFSAQAWSRWKQGIGPSDDNWKLIQSALEALIADKAA